MINPTNCKTSTPCSSDSNAVRQQQNRESTKQIKSTIGLIFFGLCFSQMHGQALLWEISGNGLSETSYLFGSIHIQDKRVFELDSVVWNRFEKASNFALEFDIENADLREMTTRMMMSRSYSDFLSDEDFQQLRNVVRKYASIPFSTAQRMHPFFLSAAISQSVLLKDEKDPLDLFLLKKAREAHKQILELESLDQQLSVIDRFSFDDQLESLLKLVRDPDLQTNLRTETESLIAAYLSQDDRKLYEIINESSDSDTFKYQLITERNHSMSHKIEAFVAMGSTFIVVGAGHLPGEEGLVNLLKNQGYTLTPIKFNEE